VPGPSLAGRGGEDRVDEVSLAQARDALDAHRAGDRVKLLTILAVEHRPFELLLGGHHLLLGIDRFGRPGPCGPAHRSDVACGERRTRISNAAPGITEPSGSGRDPREGSGHAPAEWAVVPTSILGHRPGAPGQPA